MRKLKKLYKSIIIFFIVLIQTLIVDATPFISEIMYDSIGEDNNKEYVEIYGTDNLSNTTFYDLTSSDKLNLLQYVNNSNISLIVEEGFNYTGLNCSIYTTGATIGDNLNNNYDNITLEIYNSDSNITINAFYNASYYSFANGNGGSIEYRNNSFFDIETPNPCNYVFFINETDNNINNTDDINTTENETDSTSNNTSIIPCLPTLLIRIKDNKTIFQTGESIKFYNIVENITDNFSIEYWIEDMKGNILKSKINTTNLQEKSYTPPSSLGEKVMIIKNRLITNCTNESFSSFIIVIFNGTNQNCSSPSQNSTSDEDSIEENNEDYKQKSCSLNGEELEILKPNIIDSESFDVVVKVTNDKITPLSYDIWSYLYRGSKSYSGDRERNKKKINLNACSSKVFYLNNEIEDAENGEYKIKVKLLKEGRKTPIEKSRDVVVNIENKNEIEEVLEEKIESEKEVKNESIFYSKKENKSQNKNNTSSITGDMVYENKYEKKNSKTLFIIAGIIAGLIFLKSFFSKK